MNRLAETALNRARQRQAGKPRKAPKSKPAKIGTASNHVERTGVVSPTKSVISTGFVAPGPVDRYLFLQGRDWAVDLVRAMRTDPAASVIERLAGATVGKPASYEAGVQSVIRALQESRP
ncbi:hypothetical protein NRB16_07405 [Pseudomonas sp. LJDD11]|uniref:hypothetical protein n=1 Tax=Pseudomonas sp. LJDD11 TaxID=2931984 RepID=UPI00211C5FFF|nr:hypothetical protein [Pseudomonas sp. LJDD11]MCQ9423348.1 hypothetical protein [Pseudomonas sp. LJDD11]